MSDRLVFCFTGTDNLQITVTPNPESFPPGKLSPISPTWPFSEVRSSSAVDRIKNGLGPTPDNTSVLQFTRTPPPKTHRRPRAPGDLSSSPYQGSGHSASLEPSGDSTESPVQPRPRGGREAAGVSGLPHTSMLPALPTVPSGASLSPVLPSQPVWVGTPSISERHSLRSDIPPLLPPSPSPSSAPASPHSIIFSKPAGPPTTVPLVPQTAPTDCPPSQSVATPLNPLADEMNHTPSPNAQDLISIPRLGFSGPSTKQYSEPSPTEDPRAAGSPTPEFLRSGPGLAHRSPPPLALGSLHLPRGTPSWSSLEVASRPASTQPITAEVAEAVHSGVSLPALKSGAVPPLFQTTESGAVEMTSRTLAAATAKDSANPLHLSAAPGNSEAEHTSSSRVPSPLPPIPAGRGRAILSGAVPASPSKGAPARNHASPSTQPRTPTPRGAGHNGPPPTAATDFLLSSKFPNLLATTWTFPLQKEDGVTAVLRKHEKAGLTVALQTLLSKEVPSLRTLNGFTSAFSTAPVPSAVPATPRTDLASESPPRSLPSTRAAQTVSPSPGLSSSNPGTDAAATGLSELPVSTSKQVTAFPSSTGVYDFSTMGSVKKPAVTDVFWSSLSAETGSLSTEPTLSGLLQQTNYAINGHTINSTSWKPHPASSPAPSVLASAANTIDSHDLKGTAGHGATAEGFRTQDSVLDTGTNQPIQQSDVTMVGNHTAVSSTSNNNHSGDFQATEVEDFPPTSQQVKSHPHVQRPGHPTWPLSLPSPSLPSTAGLQEMFSEGTDTSSQISSNFYPSPVVHASTPFQSLPRYRSTAESPVSTGASLRTPSKVLPPSQRPKKWTGAATNAGSLFPGTQQTVDFTVSSKADPTAAAAASSLLPRKSSPPALSAALVAKGTGSSPSAWPRSSVTTALARHVTNNTASGPKATPGAGHPAFSFTPAYMFAKSAHATSTHTAMQGDTGTASGLLSTTHLPRKPQAMHTSLPHPTNPDLPRASTTRSLTITAAWTSITAPATRLPPLLAENPNAALPAVSTAMVTTGRMASNLECQMSSKLLVKTVLFLTQRRAQISETLKLSIAKGLTQALRKASHQNDVSAHVDILEHSHNVTVGYYATKGRLVYLPAVVIEMLGVYGVSNVTADLKQHTPSLQSFVSQSDNIQSCRFAQTMEQRLQKAFQDAERKVLSAHSNLTIQIVSTSNASQTVTLVYVVANRSSFLNGTVASSLLRQLSAELVGFYLTYPPLTIAEPLEYPNLDISETTRDYWVITVLQGVDNSLVGLHNQSFARVMEQRLAQLFMMSQQQGRRFKRATTLGSYTVQMVKMQRVPGPKDPAELTYYTLYNGKPLLGTAAAKILSTIDSQRMALTLHHVVLLQADPVVKNPPNNLWIIAAVLAPIAVVTVIIIIITAVLCRKNKNDFKPDAVMNLPQRAKPVQGFDYAKQHLGQQGADEEVIPVTQETVVLPLPARDAPASQERDVAQDGSTIKTAKSTETRKSRSPSENGSVISNESGKPSSGRRSPQNGTAAQQKATKEEARKRTVPASDEEEGAVLFDSSGKAAADPFDSSSGSVQLIAVKPTALPVVHPTPDRSQEAAALNGEVNKALKQKSDIEHYRNKLRLKAKRKGYYDFPAVETNKAQTERKKMYEKSQKEIEHVLDPDPELCAPFAESKNRQQTKNSVYRSRQSLNSPSPGKPRWTFW
ncbi:LOW QUALITY PROTEIN: hypothetical protein QTO34_003460 [Cnephaeus nilssonii]|uniref:KIAA1549 like n=1 Tax=Cnephaeus nilssonii TaxID=3371016 RepID=A0AA40HRU7_CNENI|nr:LOW QUALITY PROTEIN: hypothetical protein QTO34_003460 [Eptesicus nilssonii]